MLEGLLLALDVFGMLVLIRWSMAQEKAAERPRDTTPAARR